MSKRTLLVGAGAMGGTILRSALAASILLSKNVHVVEHCESTCEQIRQELGVTASTELPDLKDFNLIVFAVKPQVLPSLLKKITYVGKDTVLVSIAAGVTLETLNEAVPSSNWFRIMPNTPIAVKAGFTAIAPYKAEEGVPFILMQIFNSMGQVEIVSEADLDRLGALSGVGPGFAFVIMDALADAGVRIGLPRELAIKAACQTFAGAGKLAIESGRHPSLLRDQVTSPGGTTIAGIVAFEGANGRGALHEAVMASYRRSEELGKKSER